MTKEIETRINRLIGKINDPAMLHRIRARAQKRVEVIHKRERQAELDRIWSEIGACSPGDWVEATENLDHFYFDRKPAIQRTVAEGDRWIVWHVQPRARRVWVIKPHDEQDADELLERIRGYEATPKGERYKWQSTVRSLNRLASYLELHDMRRIGLRRADVDQTVTEA